MKGAEATASALFLSNALIGYEANSGSNIGFLYLRVIGGCFVAFILVSIISSFLPCGAIIIPVLLYLYVDKQEKKAITELGASYFEFD